MQAQSQVASTARQARLVASSRTPRLRYTLLKSDTNSKDYSPVQEADLKAGDLIRFQVFAPVAGHVTLSRLDQAGDWEHLADFAVLANSTYRIPDSPIIVPREARRFRLTLGPMIPQAQVVGGIATGIGGDNPARRSTSESQAVATPSMIEFTLGGKTGN